LESEFGRETLVPLYRFLWRLNCGDGVKTTHLVERRLPQQKSPVGFDWAQENAGVNIILHPGNEDEWLEEQIANKLKFGFLNLLGDTSPLTAPRGWYFGVTTIRMYYHRGEELLPALGVELQTSGFAGTRQRAGERWSAMIGHVVDSLERCQRQALAVAAHP